MKTIGIVGGIACGKSTVAEYLHNLGAGVIKADDIVHEVLNVPEIVDQINMRWGKSHGILFGYHPGGKVDRKKIADIVFKDKNELKFLEQITWPEIARRMQEKMRLYHPVYTPALVLDAPLLFEAGWDSLCDMIIFIDMSYGDRMLGFLRDKTRHPDRTATDLDAREAQQLPLAEKKKRSSHVIINSRHSWDDTKKQIDEIWKTIPLVPVYDSLIDP